MRRLALVCIALASGGARAALPPAGSSYALQVTTNFESPFADCWSFSASGTVITSYKANLGRFPYRLANLNTSANQFEAVVRGPVGIGFAGVTSASGITGDAVDSLGRSYHFTGTPVSSCAGAAALPAGAGFQRR